MSQTPIYTIGYGSSFDRLRHHLGLTETNVIYPVTDAE